MNILSLLPRGTRSPDLNPLLSEKGDAHSSSMRAAPAAIHHLLDCQWAGIRNPSHVRSMPEASVNGKVAPIPDVAMQPLRRSWIKRTFLLTSRSAYEIGSPVGFGECIAPAPPPTEPLLVPWGMTNTGNSCGIRLGCIGSSAPIPDLRALGPQRRGSTHSSRSCARELWTRLVG